MPKKKVTTEEKPEEVKETNPSNPNGANQFMLDPRQLLCWKFYTDIKSETFGNATQSAIKAGYTADYADQITTVEWFKGKVRRMNLLNKSEKVLDEVLDMPVEVLRYDTSTGKKYDGDDEEYETEQYLETDPAIIRIKLDAAKFVASTQGKDEGYSTRSEVTGAGGGAIEIDDNTRNKSKSALGRFLQGNRKNS